ncbi:helix-turn-helix transcriptional regulator [Noviherbaspirillum massiliense]|uniref:helix-turn-helix transcriptional regulator n=1 Tax=Noviherbaspirillum massiliense TaxID=1465823 RepID=UPI0006890C47|nr:helix-turn-helix transcriptional regulator [Noviherbaspirillum massiliense]
MTSKLGAFVRAHRERIGPASIGLPTGERRRTPGLRREELAVLCGVSATWITWLEQGRPVTASAKTLSGLATALRLSKAERSYLFRLADKVDPDAHIKDLADAKAKEISGLVEVISTPAYVLDRQWNAVAWNDPAAQLFLTWLGKESLEGERNLLRFMFLQASARDFVVDWPERARRLVAEFRAECGKGIDDPPIKDLIAALRDRSSDFALLWDAQEVVTREGGIRTFMHPFAGRLTFEQMALQLQGRPDLKLTILLQASK